MKALKIRGFFGRSKKWWFFGGIGLGTLFLISLVIWNVYAWQDYTRQHLASHAKMRESAKGALSLKASTSEERSRKIDALKQLKQAIQNTNICEQYQLLHWEQFIPDVKHRIESCHQAMGRVREFGNSLQSVVSFLEDDTKIGNIFKELGTGPASADEATWQGISDAWKVASDKISRLSINQEAKPTQQAAIAYTQAVHDAWASLITANTTKDKQKFEAAVDKVGTAYSGFGQITDTSEKALATLATTSEKAYRAAFY